MRGLATRFRRLARHPTYTKVVCLVVTVYVGGHMWSRRGWAVGLVVVATWGTLTICAFLPRVGVWLDDRGRWSAPLFFTGLMFTAETVYTRLPALDCLMAAVMSGLLLGALVWRRSIARR